MCGIRRPCGTIFPDVHSVVKQMIALEEEAPARGLTDSEKFLLHIF
jgi:hypothetical protein